MAGYSGTPLPKKLGIKEGSSVVLVNAPEGFEAALEPLPGGVRLSRRLRDGVDIIVLFVTSRDQLDRRFPDVSRRLSPAGGLWVAWPKKASGVVSDLSDTAVMEIGLRHGLVDNKTCAITDVWAGLRFVVRLADRPSWGRAGVSPPRRGRP